MLLRTVVWLCLFVILCITLVITSYKKIDRIKTTFMILWESVIMYIIAIIFFPFPFEKNTLKEKAYESCEQSLSFFKQERRLINVLGLKDIKKLIILIINLNIKHFIAGVLIGILIVLSCKNTKSRIIFIVCFSVIIQLLECFICYSINANYIRITLDNYIVIFGGYLFGYFIICFIRKMLDGVEYKNSFFAGMQKIINVNKT